MPPEISPLLNPALPSGPAPARWSGSRAVAIVGAAVSGGAVAAFSGDWACSAFSAAVLAAIVCGFTARFAGWRAGRHRRSVGAALAVLIVVLAVAQVSWTRCNLRRNAFRDAFDTDPPAAVRELRVRRHYAGGPGDTVTLLRFKADADAIAALVARIPPSEQNYLLEDFRARRMPAPDLWRNTFGLANSWAGSWWPADGPALQDPLLYGKRANPKQVPPRSTTILWDRATGDVYVMTTVG